MNWRKCILWEDVRCKAKMKTLKRHIFFITQYLHCNMYFYVFFRSEILKGPLKACRRWGKWGKKRIQYEHRILKMTLNSVDMVVYTVHPRLRPKLCWSTWTVYQSSAGRPEIVLKIIEWNGGRERVTEENREKRRGERERNGGWRRGGRRRETGVYVAVIKAQCLPVLCWAALMSRWLSQGAGHQHGPGTPKIGDLYRCVRTRVVVSLLCWSLGMRKLKARTPAWAYSGCYE